MFGGDICEFVEQFYFAQNKLKVRISTLHERRDIRTERFTAVVSFQLKSQFLD